MHNYCVAVPCKSYIRKYFASQLGDPIALNHTTDFGDTILTKLSGKPLIRISKQQFNVAFKDYNDQLKFRIPFDFFYRIQNNISSQHIFAINRFLQNVFEADLFVIVNIGAAFGVQRRTAIEAFARKYGINLDEDISFDALIKNESRKRAQKTLANNFLVSLSSNPAIFLRA